ncbi:MAG TPA: hypothetical protein VL490_07930 [Mucilaginibacter sp.]|nr:hypothetical protein [Mucilaginibacter sp.]
MFYIRFVFILSSVLFVIRPAKAQVLNDLKNGLEQYRQNSLHEKLYVHTDKNFYLTGEILWFKIYDVNGGNNQPLNFSKVAYVEVLNGTNTAVMQAKIELKNTTGNGSIYIPVSLNNGNYKFRVYTNWMKNFSPDSYFEKTLTIINSLKSPVAAVDTPPPYNVQFFPEGGNLVKNIAGKVAFKVTGRDGKGTNFKGAILNQRNDTVARFSPLKFGMGTFMFTPMANNTYRAVIKLGADKPVTQNLPDVKDEGYVMQVDANNGSYNVTVKGSLANQSAQIFFLVHARQITKMAEAKTLENGTITFSIDKAKLDDGVNIITIFNGNKQPVCERLIFKQPTKTLQITANTDQAQYSTRKKVNISLSTNNPDQKQVSSNLSVSVYKIDSLQTADENDILSYLWLCSDMKGNIESPGYYLKNNDAEAAAALDNLLLTQGWRRFSWSDVLAGNTYSNYEFLPEYNGHLISGKLKQGTADVTRAGIIGYLSIPGNRVQLYTAPSDYRGQFIFNAKLFYGPNELVSQTEYSTADSVYHIELNNPFSLKYTDWTLPLVDLKTESKATLLGKNLYMQVQNIYSGPKNNRFYEPVVDTTAFYGTPTNTYMLDDYTRFPTMEEVLKEYVTGVFTSRSRGKYQIRIFNEENFIKEGPLVMMDGVPVFDIDKTYSINPLKVKKLEVVHNRYFYGPAVAEGILSFTSYKGDMGGFEIDPKSVVIDYEGLNLQREFYSPVYETEQQMSSRLPDFRNVLFWKPNVITDSQGKSTLSFYTSDQQGKYIGIVQGITPNGNAGSRYFNFEVRK